MRMFDDLFRVNGNDYYLQMATQSYRMTGQIMLCPDICPCISNSLFLTLAYYLSKLIVPHEKAQIPP
jgi:hypothetical protein